MGRFPERLLFDLLLGADLNVFFNYFDSFDPSGRRISIEGNELASPKGETKEFGFMLDEGMESLS